MFCKGWFDWILRTRINKKKIQENTHKPITSPITGEQICNKKPPKVQYIQKNFRLFKVLPQTPDSKWHLPHCKELEAGLNWSSRNSRFWAKPQYVKFDRYFQRMGT